MKVLITGAAGFIGSHLVSYHLNKGDEVYGVDDLSSGRIENIEKHLHDPHFQFVKHDILLWKDIETIVSQCNRIYHLAAIVGVFKVLKEPDRVLSVNIKGTERLLQAIRQTKNQTRIIIASSSEVYGFSTAASLSERDNLIIETPQQKRSFYAISKLVDEAMGIAYGHADQVAVTIVRLFNTIGPQQVGFYGMVVPRFIEQARKNLPMTIFGDGSQTRSFCDVRDTVKILDLLASTDKSVGEIVNVGNDDEITIRDLAERIKKLLHSHSELSYLSYKEAYGEEYKDIMRRKPDLDKLKSLIQFNYQWDLSKTILDLGNVKNH
jgi:UDP-glucose 4-epimerase